VAGVLAGILGDELCDDDAELAGGVELLLPLLPQAATPMPTAAPSAGSRKI